MKCFWKEKRGPTSSVVNESRDLDDSAEANPSVNDNEASNHKPEEAGESESHGVPSYWKDGPCKSFYSKGLCREYHFLTLTPPP